MKTNFDSKLFEKKINLDSCNSIMGGKVAASGCVNTTFSGPSGATYATDTTTTHYNDSGQVTSVQTCQN